MPGIIYGHGEEPVPFSIAQHDLQLLLHQNLHLLGLEMDGSTQQYLIKQIQYDHLGRYPMHMDLARVNLDERVKVRVTLHLRGTPKGAKEGGVLVQLIDALDVECLAVNIPDVVTAHVTDLGVGDALLVRQVTLPPDVVALNPPDEKLAIIRVVAAEVEAVAPAEAAETTAEPERIGRVAKVEEGAEDSKEKKKEK